MDKQAIWEATQALQSTLKTTADNAERLSAHVEIAALQRICATTHGGHLFDGTTDPVLCIHCGAARHLKAA